MFENLKQIYLYLKRKENKIKRIALTDRYRKYTQGKNVCMRI